MVLQSARLSRDQQLRSVWCNGFFDFSCFSILFSFSFSFSYLWILSYLLNAAKPSLTRVPGFFNPVLIPVSRSKLELTCFPDSRPCFYICTSKHVLTIPNWLKFVLDTDIGLWVKRKIQSRGHSISVLDRIIPAMDCLSFYSCEKTEYKRIMGACATLQWAGAD